MKQMNPIFKVRPMTYFRTLRDVNKVRRIMGKPRLALMPAGVVGDLRFCPIAMALDDGKGVEVSQISFGFDESRDEGTLKAIADALGTSIRSNGVYSTQDMRDFIDQFDR